MRVLITGGSGYIGSHVCRLLKSRGDEPVVVDDFVTGDPARIPEAASYRLDLTSSDAVDRLHAILVSERIDSVIHFAARKQVAESVQRPLWYLSQNIGGLAAVLEAVTKAGVRDFVFSSSAAVYGDAGGVVDEDAATVPVNPYGQSKLAGEWLVADVARASELNAISLRYFNVAGAGWTDLADRAVLNLVPMALERIDSNEGPQIFGDDYDTADGTCVRDFVHVLDVAEAHLIALSALPTQRTPHRVYNVGTGVGASVREVVEGIRRRAGDVPAATVQPRRPGDPAVVIASVDRIERELGWSARLGLDDILDAAWAWRSTVRDR